MTLARSWEGKVDDLSTEEELGVKAGEQLHTVATGRHLLLLLLLRGWSYHMSMGVEYSVEPSSTSGGRYHRVTTSLE